MALHIYVLTYHKHDWGSDDAEHGHVVDGHADEARVVDLLHLLGARFVRQEQAQHQLKALVSVDNAWKGEGERRGLLRTPLFL